jgi:hypothetical protein
MARSVKRLLLDGTMGVTSVGVVLAGMAAIDETTRGYFDRVIGGDVQMFALLPNLRVHRIIQTVTDFGEANAPMVLFAGVAAVLFVLMFKT